VVLAVTAAEGMEQTVMATQLTAQLIQAVAVVVQVDIWDLVRPAAQVGKVLLLLDINFSRLINGIFCRGRRKRYCS
jgi:hypothetical protein